MTASVLVGGESLVDLIVDPTGRIVASPGGGPYNTARAIARLGVPVSFVARISTDRFGREALDRLVADGVAVDTVVATDDPSTLAVAELDTRGVATYRFYTEGTAAPGLTGGDIPAPLSASVGAVHVGTLGLVLEPLAAALEILVGRAAPETLVMLDPNCRPAATPDRRVLVARLERLLARSDIVKVSTDDLAYLRPDVPSDVVVADLLAGGPAAVLLTDGPRDVAIVTGRGIVRLPAARVEVVDTVGAGDAFSGGFLAAWIGAGRTRADLADDDALHAAVRHGMRVASYTCARAGADPPTAAELADWAPAG